MHSSPQATDLLPGARLHGLASRMHNLAEAIVISFSSFVMKNGCPFPSFLFIGCICGRIVVRSGGVCVMHNEIHVGWVGEVSRDELRG